MLCCSSGMGTARQRGVWAAGGVGTRAGERVTRRSAATGAVGPEAQRERGSRQVAQPPLWRSESQQQGSTLGIHLPALRTRLAVPPLLLHVQVLQVGDHAGLRGGAARVQVRRQVRKRRRSSGGRAGQARQPGGEARVTSRAFDGRTAPTRARAHAALRLHPTCGPRMSMIVCRSAAAAGFCSDSCGGAAARTAGALACEAREPVDAPHQEPARARLAGVLLVPAQQRSAAAQQHSAAPSSMQASQPAGTPASKASKEGRLPRLEHFVRGLEGAPRALVSVFPLPHLGLALHVHLRSEKNAAAWQEASGQVQTGGSQSCAGRRGCRTRGSARLLPTLQPALLHAPTQPRHTSPQPAKPKPERPRPARARAARSMHGGRWAHHLLLPRLGRLLGFVFFRHQLVLRVVAKAHAHALGPQLGLQRLGNALRRAGRAAERGCR